jgi:formylglycine-generating enzyme required for sulfatase activity
MGRSAIVALTTLMCLFAVAAVRGADTGAPFAAAPFDAPAAGDLQQETTAHLDEPVVRTIDLGDGAQLELVLIPAGQFDVGSPRSEEARENDEGPARRVTIGKPFYIGRFEVTQAQWKAVMRRTRSDLRGADLPADGVRWAEAVEFCARLSEREPETFRLPTEAEWECACRAGSTTRYSFGDDASFLVHHAWFNSNSDHKTHPVGQKTANAFGLHDMHGNVWEWCSDWYDNYLSDATVDPTGSPDGSSHVLRGGSWFCTPGPCRSANRGWNTPYMRDDDVRFRVVMECPE